jgi:hypothetical protein
MIMLDGRNPAARKGVIMARWTWLIVAALGLGLMFWASGTRFRPDPASSWAHGFIIYGPEKAAKGPDRLPGLVVPTRVRLLSGNERAEVVLKALDRASKSTLNLRAVLRPKLFEVALAGARIDARALQSGRLPEPGRDEILAGTDVVEKDKLKVGGRTLEVVGVLGPDAFLFHDGYLIEPSGAGNVLFPEDDPAVHVATLVGLKPEEFGNRKSLKQIGDLYPAPKYTAVMPLARQARRPYYLYLAGQALFLLGGSGLLIGMYRWLAEKLARPATVEFDSSSEPTGAILTAPIEKSAAPRWLSAPLIEIARRPRLVWAVHLIYFGLVFVGAVIVYELPEVQSVLMSEVQDQLSGKHRSPLALAGAAYGSGNIPFAAAVTFTINFFLGSLLMITLPSMIVPGLGVVIGVIRPLAWGFLLAPTTVIMALGMIPHSGTMLLEGEGYILAVLFGLLIPVYLVQSSLGGSLSERLRRALWLNVQACALVAAVLAVAAIYEATEVIWMAG